MGMASYSLATRSDKLGFDNHGHYHKLDMVEARRVHGEKQELYGKVLDYSLDIDDALELGRDGTSLAWCAALPIREHKGEQGEVG